MISGKLRIMGRIDVIEEDQPTGRYEYGRALLIEFDSDETIRQAIKDEACRFSFGEPDTAHQSMSFHVQELRPEVLAFALLMEQRLREKDADKGDSWKRKKLAELEVAAGVKLSSAYASNPITAARHAIDLANYCMMIADVAGALDTTEGNGGPGWEALDQVQMA